MYTGSSVGFAFAHPTCRGLRIALIVETDNAESPRMVYINPTREQPHAYRKYIHDRSRQGTNIPTVSIYWLPLPFDDYCKLRSYDMSKTGVK